VLNDACHERSSPWGEPSFWMLSLASSDLGCERTGRSNESDG
jgi:hypothetical protein